MRNRWLLNLALLAFIVALALLVKYQPGKRVEEKDRSGPPLTAIAADDIQRIRLERPQQEPIVLVRDGAEWRLDAPVKARADRFRVDGLLQLAGVRTEGKLPASDLQKFGLDRPLARVWLNDAEIRFGSMHALQELQYVWFNGEVALVPAGNARALGTRLEDFFSTALLEKDRKPLAFALPDFKVALEGGTWKRTPAIADLSGDRINGFVEEWRYARALNVTRHKRQASLGKVVVDYVDEGGDGAKPPAPGAQPPTQRLEFDILMRTPEFILHRRDEGLDYHFPPDTGTRLLQLKPE